jgi:hypothetical protein
VKACAFNDKNRDNKRHNTGKPFVPGVKVEVYFSILIIATVLALGLTDGNNGVTTLLSPFPTDMDLKHCFILSCHWMRLLLTQDYLVV